MAFGLKLRKVPKDEIDKMVREAARILDLEALLDRKPYLTYCIHEVHLRGSNESGYEQVAWMIVKRLRRIYLLYNACIHNNDPCTKSLVREAARILDLEALLDRKPKALSGGQRQRVAID